MPASPHPVITGYRLGPELGRGGTGVVYAATRLADGHDVALKVLRPELTAQPGHGTRLREEADRARAIDHPGVVRILDVESETGAWLAMDRIDGPDLQRRLDDGPLDPATAVAVVRQVADAVAALHAAGIVHCDLKPANVLLTGPPDGLRAHVTDFGLAAAVATVDATLGTGSLAQDEWLHSLDLTADEPAEMAGTVTYMAPEQWRGEQATPRSDVYALGGLLYAALTGRRPYPQRTLTELALAVATEPPPAPSRYGAPAAFDAVVRRAMAKDPAQRYADVPAFAAALNDAAEGRRVASAGTPRRRWIAAGITLLVVLAAAGLYVLLRPTPDSSASVTRSECAESATLRDQPGGHGHTIGQLRRGDVVTLDHHQDSGFWSYVRTADGRAGWTLNEYLRTGC
ncbi:protein kinase domain-containing protein [Amycolatopsis sp. cmx-4-61]|uniref:protein kinase domain-containing protein n=1 Tax=Amycolatopsis sp. cmx-4-61 TaxID=2790937 RepID=UPI00397C7E86